jgi:pimeloyl-ACP methyl ester carboxylesterase
MRRWTLALLLLATARPATAQLDNLGSMFEKAAKNVAREALVGPNGLAQAVAGPQASPPRSEDYTVQTRDGWTLVAHRFRPRVAPPAALPPVILCHGLSYNASFWDLDPSCSFVEFLTGRGYDVWVVDLRGSGESSKWVARLDEAPEMVIGEAVRKISRNKVRPTGFASVDPKFSNWTLDHHIAYDVPAFVRLVKRQTRAGEVVWIGHSMGGIVAIAHLARHGNPGIGKLVAVGSQVTMPDGQVPIQFLREMMELRGHQLTAGLSTEQLLAETRTSVNNLFFNQRNVLPQVYRELTTVKLDIPSLGVMQQYMTLAMGGELLDARKAFNYADALGNVTVPVLFACGADDQFAPPPVQQHMHDRVGSADKTLLVFGRASGFAADSGHNDALVGLNSAQQVFPTIEAWIRGARPRR